MPNYIVRCKVFFKRAFQYVIILSSFKAGIPAVCIVVGGSHRHIKAIYETVVENRVPVIVLEGSGGAADVIAYAYRNMSMKDVSKHG